MTVKVAVYYSATGTVHALAQAPPRPEPRCGCRRVAELAARQRD